tara:strand:- start:173 stop:808 length:636 start_codon:yes stop_codon:yes gene_type:complete
MSYLFFYLLIVIIIIVLLLFLGITNSFETFTNICQPIYEPEKWNVKYVQDSHNCYSYSINQIEQDRINNCINHVENNKSCGQRGPPRPKKKHEYKHPKNKKVTCESITLGVLDDIHNAERLKGKECPQDKYKVALFIDDKHKSFHFLRQDKCNNPDKIWSHKNVTGPVTQKDVDGNIIYDVEKANLKYSWVNYDKMCNYLCIPDDSFLEKN